MATKAYKCACNNDRKSSLKKRYTNVHARSITEYYNGKKEVAFAFILVTWGKKQVGRTDNTVMVIIILCFKPTISKRTN